jgi:hypothetical protein
MIMERVAAAQAAGAIGRGDPLEIAMFFWAQLHGLAMLHRSGRFAMPRAAFFAFAARAVERTLDAFHPDAKEIDA